MRIKEAVKRGFQIRKVERFYAIAPDGAYFELYPEAQLFYGVVYKKMPKRKRTLSKAD